MMRSLLGAVCALTLAGCTSLSTRADFERSGMRHALPGVPYRLPMLQYEVKTAWKLIGCEVIAGTQFTAPVFKITSEAEPGYVAGESYVVDPTSLASVFKTTDITIETYEGTGALKSLNASADDKTSDVVKGVVEAGVKIASIAAGVPAGAVIPAAGSPKGDAEAFLARFEGPADRPVCGEDAATALAGIEKENAQIALLTAAMAKDTAIVEAITVRAGLKLSRAADRAALANAQARHVRDAALQAAAKERSDKAGGKLAYSETVPWPMDPFETEGAVPTSELWRVWVSRLVDRQQVTSLDVSAASRALEEIRRAYADAARPPDRQEALSRPALDIATGILAKERSLTVVCTLGSTDGQCLEQRLGLYAALVQDVPPPTAECAPAGPADGPCIRNAGAIAARDAVPDPGLFIRPPGRARLVLCDERSRCVGTAQKPILATKMVSAPQAGQLRFLPLSNGPFQNNGLSVALRADGSVEKLQYAEKSAIAASAASSLSATAGTIDTAIDDRRKERDKALADAQALIAGERTERAAAREDAAKSRADEIAQIQYEIDLINKRRDLLKAQDPADPIVAADVTNETLRLNADLELLRARLAFLKAQRELAAATA